jgi:hypothetical protein
MLKKLLILVVLCSTPGFASDSSKGKAETSERLAFATFKARVDRVELVVGSLPAAIEEKEEYLPLQIAVGVFGKGPELTITLDSFTLFDAHDQVYDMAMASQVDTGLQQYVAQINRNTPLQTGADFQFSQVVVAGFYSPEGVTLDNVHLDRETFMVDTIYFVHPKDGIEGVLTLRLLTEGMDKPVDVRFTVPLKHKKNRGDSEGDSADG